MTICGVVWGIVRVEFQQFYKSGPRLSKISSQTDDEQFLLSSYSPLETKLTPTRHEIMLPKNIQHNICCLDCQETGCVASLVWCRCRKTKTVNNLPTGYCCVVVLMRHTHLGEYFPPVFTFQECFPPFPLLVNIFHMFPPSWILSTYFPFDILVSHSFIWQCTIQTPSYAHGQKRADRIPL